MPLALMSRQLGSARPTLPLHPNAPEPLLETGETTLSHGERMNQGQGSDQGCRRHQVQHFVLPWLLLGPGRAPELHQHSCNHGSEGRNGETFLPPLCAEAGKCDLFPCATHRAATTTAPTLLISGAVTGRRQSPGILQRQEAPESQDEWYFEENSKRFRACSN